MDVFDQYGPDDPAYDPPRCKTCGDPAKFRGDRVGDHEMGEMYYPYCGGDLCAAELPNHG